MGEVTSIETPTEEVGSDNPNTEQPNESNTSEGNETRPAWLPEKFENAEAFAEAYKALEVKQGTAGDETSADNTTEDVKPAEDAKVVAGVTQEEMQRYSQNYNTNGGLAEEDYADLQAKGLSREMVDTYIKGQLSLNSQYESNVHAEVGGVEQYAKITEWATAALSTEELDIYDSAMESGNAAQALSAARGLSARYQVEHGKEPTLLAGSTSQGTNEGYASMAEMKADMRNPKYAVDPAFRDMVTRKIESSTVL